MGKRKTLWEELREMGCEVPNFYSAGSCCDIARRAASSGLTHVIHYQPNKQDALEMKYCPSCGKKL